MRWLSGVVGLRSQLEHRRTKGTTTKKKSAKTTTTTTRQESISSPLRSLVLGASCKLFGTIVEPSLLGTVWKRALLGLYWGPLGGLGGNLWGHLGGLWGSLGTLLAALEPLLGLSWRPSIKKGVDISRSSRRGLPKGSRGASGGRSWARLETLLGPAWGHLGVILGLQKPIGGEKARTQKTSMLSV